MPNLRWFVQLEVLPCTVPLRIRDDRVFLPPHQIHELHVDWIKIKNERIFDRSKRWHVLNLQTSCKASRFVLNDRRLWRFTHDNQFLIRLHYYARELWKPNPNVHKSLRNATKLKFDCFHWYFDLASVTFRLRTPHLEKSVIFKLYVTPSASAVSCRIKHVRSVSGFTDRSSANSGAPLNPTGFFRRAVIASDALEPCAENEHCISLTTVAKRAKKRKHTHIRLKTNPIILIKINEHYHHNLGHRQIMAVAGNGKWNFVKVNLLYSFHLNQWMKIN